MKHTLLLGLAITFATPSYASFFDWESTTLGFQPSVSEINSGVTATATTSLGVLLIQNIGGQTNYAGFQTRSIWAQGGVLRIDFDTLIDAATIQVGDLGQDDDGLVTFTGYDINDNVVDSTSLNYGLGNAPIWLSIAGPNIAYVTGTSGGPIPDTMFWDNLEINPVPEPATMALLGLGAAAILRRRNRK